MNADLLRVVCQYVGEEGEDCLLSAAVVVGNPFNLEVANICLQGSLLGKEVYQRVMGSACREVREEFLWNLALSH